MQTFLPYADFHKTAACLDNRRLGKQRVKVLQILRTMAGYTEGWKNHPAVLMWTNYEDALVDYGLVICKEWKRRGFRDTCQNKIKRFISFHVYDLPPWIGNRAFHASHRSNLLRKDPAHYGKFGWKEGPDLPYVWPTKE